MKCSAAMATALSLATLAIVVRPASAATLRGSQAARLPGAGMAPKALTPFRTAYMDGFFPAGCIDDEMFLHADKFGDNKYDYTLGAINVSIVHYSMHVAKEDQKQMTHEVCFTFCRSVPHMSFFGLVNGRECYCTPYYKSIEGDSSQCDMPCDGKPTTMCGGKTKSSIFSMHMCDTTATDLAKAGGKLIDMGSELAALAQEVTATKNTLQMGGATYQDMFGQAGDPAAADLMQTAKARAGVLAEAAGIATALTTEMNALRQTVDYMAGNFSGSAGQLKGAEETLTTVKATMLNVKKSTAELEQLLEETSPNISVAGAGKQYYPVMYFVDKAYANFPSTCSGTAAHTPMALSFDGCARACDGKIHNCVGFSYFPPTPSMQEGLCFLLSDFETAKYYSKCTLAPQAEKVQCVAKYSKFPNVSLKPDASGKCKECFKEVEEAARCFQ